MKKMRWGIVELRHVKAELGYPATRSSLIDNSLVFI